jgi:hypothetical protein
MRDRLAASALLAALAFPAAALAVEQTGTATGKPVIAVADFGANNASPGDAAVVSELVRAAVFRGGNYSVVEKKSMDAVLAEQAFQQTGCTTEECAVKMGRLLNVQKMVMGTYGVFEGVRVVTARVVDVETGKIEANEVEKGFAAQDIDAASGRLVARLLKAPGARVQPRWLGTQEAPAAAPPARRANSCLEMLGACCAAGGLVVLIALLF